MKDIFLDYLFSKNLLVSDGEGKDAFETLFSLANLFGIRVVSGQELAGSSMIRVAERCIGLYVPPSFYRGFPKSVKALTAQERIFDQLVHYAVTYGLGDASAPGYSIFERDFERTAFKENTPIKDFAVITEEEAVRRLFAAADDMMASSRPLSEGQYALLLACVKEYGYRSSRCASKDTAVKLLLDTRSMAYARFLRLSDVLRVVDHLSYTQYKNRNLKKLNLKNRDRKFISRLIDVFFTRGECNTSDCFEKKRLWNGLLHHIHYRPVNESAAAFVSAIRGRENPSAYSAFEKQMRAGNVGEAVSALIKVKGSGAVLRNLTYILSRCRTREEVCQVLGQLKTANPVILIQLYIEYSADKPQKAARTFQFASHHLLRIHHESETECARRRSFISDEIREMAASVILENLTSIYRGRLGRVYIAPGMERIAVDLQQTTGFGGVGVLPRGTRMPIPEGKKVRCFTYWEKVNDIDLSMIALFEDGGEIEYSWRTMWDDPMAGIVFSGDQTSGFDGGSEYFDVDIDEFLLDYPEAQYLICCDNVYSEQNFDECICKAGYMTRDIEDSGEVFEPKTVATAFAITCQSTFAYLFAIDLRTREIVWLNTGLDSGEHVAGKTSLDFLRRYLHADQIMSVKTLMSMMAQEVVGDPMEADVVVTDETLELREGVEVIRSWDTERFVALMNRE